MKLHLHIDNRLIHGQVTVTWCSFYGANMIIVVNDKVAVDPIQKIMLPQAARGLPTKVLGVKEAIDYLKTLENQPGAALVIAKTPEDALGLLDGGLKFESVNVGNQAPVPGTKPVMVFPWIAVTSEDAQTYQKITAYGYRITPKRTPADRDIDLVEELKKEEAAGLAPAASSFLHFVLVETSATYRAKRKENTTMKYFQVIKDLIPLLEREEEHMKQAGHLMAQSIMNGGIIQAFGSGHSYAASIEIAGRAGGLLPAKAVMEETFGRYETIEGVGTKFIESWDLREKDCVVIISNSGRNPFIIEMASFVKSKNVPLIAVTALEVSKNSTSRHSSGKRLFELADVVLDNHSIPGDAAVEIEGLYTKVGGTSSIAADLLLNQTVVFAIEEMLANNFEPPVLMSANIDGGPEFNDKLKEKYRDLYGYRIWINK